MLINRLPLHAAELDPPEQGHAARLPALSPRRRIAHQGSNSVDNPPPAGHPICSRAGIQRPGLGNLGDWLGSGTIANQRREYRPFVEAREYAWLLHLPKKDAWREFVKSGQLPMDIPRHPEVAYKDKGWENWGDWLGSGTIANKLRNH